MTVARLVRRAFAKLQAVMAGPTNWLTDRAVRTGGVELSFADYQIAYGQLPWTLRRDMEERWGKPEADPFFEAGEVDCGRFRLSVRIGDDQTLPVYANRRARIGEQVGLQVKDGWVFDRMSGEAA